MKAIKTYIFIMLLLYPVITLSQQFWNLTGEFWGGPKTDITLVDDSVLIVSTTTGILKSADEGYHFEKVLAASAVHSLYTASDGTIFAGGTGKIYFSEDLGAAWDSVVLNSVYPVRQITQDKNKALYAITGENNEGDGVFFSDDYGKTWQLRNNGLEGLKGCRNIVAGKNGRLYLTVTDEKSTGKGGLFISETSGLLWEKIPIHPDSISGPVKITHPTGLSISPNDSLYLSFYGVASNYLVQLNISKSINDVHSDNPWKVFQVHKSSSWWMDRPLSNIHFAQNGDRYSSHTGTLNQGGTWFLKSGDVYWSRIDYGLGVSEDGLRHEQRFAENKSGRIFMVQYRDERIYTTDKSQLTDVNPPVKYPEPLHIYPNPVKAGNKVNVQISKIAGPVDLLIFDLTGRKISGNSFSTGNFEITGPKKAGMYIIAIKHRGMVLTEKITAY